jgi:hypothetical protein
MPAALRVTRILKEKTTISPKSQSLENRDVHDVGNFENI